MILNREEIKNNQKRQFIIYCLLFSILFIPNFFTVLFATDLQRNLVMSFTYLILSVLVWLLPLLILDTKNYFRLGILFLIFAPIEIGFLKSTGLPINVGLMETLLNTNFQEAKEQILTNFPTVLFFLVLVIIYCYLLTFVSKKSAPIKWKVGLIAVFLVVNLGIFANMFSLLESYIPTKERIQVAYENTTRKYNKIYPANILFNSYYAFKINRSNIKFAQEIEKFSFGAKQNLPNNENEIYVLVIGETARKHNFHLYGYSRETTPELEKIENLVPFSNAHSSATLTLQSLPQIITRADPEQMDLEFKEKTILDAFHEAGFFTAWIGSQNISTAMIKRLKPVADYTFFAKSDISSSQFYDGDVLKNIQEIINVKTSKKKLIIIHSLGSHFRYSNRYPPEFEKFQPNISRSGYSNMSLDYKKELINSYDNSILYTDYFLSSIIKKLKKTNSLSGLIYLSDHGENLYDDNKTLFHGGEKPTHFEYEVPYLIWYSQKFKDFYPEKTHALNQNKDKKISSTATFFTLADFANIGYKNSTPEKSKSILNPDYKEPTKRKLVTSKKEIIFTD